MKLKTKIQLFSSLFMFVLILFINASVYFMFYKISSDSELEELHAQANTITSALNSNQDIAGNDLLKAFLQSDEMIRVIPQDGEPLTHAKDKAFFDLPATFTTTESKSITALDGESYAVISKPIIWSNGNIVTLQVTKHLVTLSENMTVLLYVLVVASIIILIPTVIAGNLLSRFLLQPIKILIQTMKINTKDGKWEKIDVENPSKDEIFELKMSYNNMIDKLREIYEKQEIFVSDASHELKTPISIVKSYAQLLEKRGLEDSELFKESVEAINSEADRMNKLVEQMLSLAKNNVETSNQKVDLVSLCEETIYTFQGAYQRDILLDKTVDSLFVTGNTDQLKQIMYILMDNALKYSEKMVKVSLLQEQNKAIFAVTDFGQGIPNSQQHRVFDRFYRIDKARSRDTGGTGLGLSIAKTIAQSNHGTLSLQSTVGEGSTFTLELPI